MYFIKSIQKVSQLTIKIPKYKAVFEVELRIILKEIEYLENLI